MVSRVILAFARIYYYESIGLSALKNNLSFSVSVVAQFNIMYYLCSVFKGGHDN